MLSYGVHDGGVPKGGVGMRKEELLYPTFRILKTHGIRKKASPFLTGWSFFWWSSETC